MAVYDLLIFLSLISLLSNDLIMPTHIFDLHMYWNPL